MEDAMHATRAAVEEGIVPRGGVTFVRAQKALDNFKLETKTSRSACRSFVAHWKSRYDIALNAGHEGSVVVEKVRADKNAGFGFNAANETYADLVREGVIDPRKAARTAPQNPASIASLLLKTEAVVAEVPEKKEKLPTLRCRAART